MDKLKEISSSLTHSFSVQERKNIALTGVVKIDSFDKEEFLIETSLGIMNIYEIANIIGDRHFSAPKAQPPGD